MEKQKSIKEKLTASLHEYAKLASIPQEDANYRWCTHVLSLIGRDEDDILKLIPKFDKVLDADQIKSFVANERVRKALSYIERWRLSRELGKEDELLYTPYSLVIRQNNDLPDFVMVGTTCEYADIHIIEFWSEFTYQDGYGRDFPETVLAIDGNVVFVLCFEPADVMDLFQFHDVWDVPKVTNNFKAKLESYTRQFRLEYAKNSVCQQIVSPYDPSKSSVDEYIGNDPKRVANKGFNLCWHGVVTRKDWRILKRLFNLGRVLYIVENRWKSCWQGFWKNSNILGVVFSEPVNDLTFVYVKGNLDIEIPISRGVILRMVPDLGGIKRLNTEA